ncbi:MAG: ATP-binding cassette domain-containing protein [Actinomycetaceae bacterium]|nr:ATP-binding cassette domain-containing protein [Actinomycetaceae bacterium]
MATVTFENASRVFPGSDKPAVDGLNLHIEDGEFLVVVGPSGCGKSTSLRMVAGLEPVTTGTLKLGGADVTKQRPKSRDVAMVFQSYALYPNMTVAGNMAFALENARMSKDDIATRVQEAAKILQLEDLLERKPGQLSGGQRQRVAMGRAIVRKPEVFCMDEPLSNLDAKLRVSTRSEIAALQRRLGVTTMYVTHDQVEAMTMGDRVAVMNDGVLQQVATPSELYDRPVNTFVASFIGSPGISLIDAPVEAGRVPVGNGRIPLPTGLAGRGLESVTMGIRPESWVQVFPFAEGGAAGGASGGASGGAAFEVKEGTGPFLGLRVQILEELGSESFAYCFEEFPAIVGASQKVAVRMGKRSGVQGGDIIYVWPKVDEILWFDHKTGQALT